MSYSKFARVRSAPWARARSALAICVLLVLAVGCASDGAAPNGGGCASAGAAPNGGAGGALGGAANGMGGTPAGGASGGRDGTLAGSGAGGEPSAEAGSGGMPGGTGGALGGTGGEAAAGAGGQPGEGALAGLPSRSSVLSALRSANDQFAAKWPDPDVPIATDRERPSNLWTRAVYYEGLMGLHAVETDAALKQSYYDYAVLWGESPSHPWQVAYNRDDTVDADHQACGQTYIDLYLIDPQPERIAHIQASIDRMIAENITDSWWWIDAIQMAMPVFTQFGVLHEDTAYFDHMWKLYAHTRDVEGGGLFNEAAGLWWRDEAFSPGDVYTRSPDGTDIYWSRGNGWVFAALVRVLDILPDTDPHREQYEADFRAMAAALLPLQREDGFWHESLTNPAHCDSIGKPGEDGPETSGTALFAYGFAWGIRTGLLDEATYGPPLVKAWNGMIETALHPGGFLGWVQSTGAAPCDNTETLGYDVMPNFEDYGVGCFLLAGSEVFKLAPP